jgi:Holliday junction resolvase RusA-like endonuclease
MRQWELWIPGEPRPQPRATVTKTGHAFNPLSKAAKAWRAALDADLARIAHDGPYDGPMGLRMHFALQRPSGEKMDPGLIWCRRAGKLSGDWDNLGKMVSDAIERAGIVTNDARFVEVVTRKFYPPIGAPTGCRIWIRQLDVPRPGENPG